jgi:dephospho-CoA kinase
MLRAALTGGIATGKSYCLAQFAALGAAVIDADRLARDAVAPGSRALEAVALRFGPSILRPDGSLDRGALGRIVFADRAARADLEAIVHPEVYRGIGE